MQVPASPCTHVIFRESIPSLEKQNTKYQIFQPPKNTPHVKTYKNLNSNRLLAESCWRSLRT